MRKTAKNKRKKTKMVTVAEIATLTLTHSEAFAMLSGVGYALSAGGEPPEDVAPHLASAIEKFNVAFGFDL